MGGDDATKTGPGTGSVPCSRLCLVFPSSMSNDGMGVIGFFEFPSELS